MAYNWDVKKEWWFKIDTDSYKIIYEGNLEKKRYFLTVNEKREEFIITEDLREKKYHLDPYEYRFKIDGLDTVLYINEDYVRLVVEEVEVEKNIKFCHPRKIKKLMDINKIFNAYSGIIIFFYLKDSWEGFLPSGIVLVLWYIYRNIKIKKWAKEIDWIKDKDGRIIQFKQNVFKQDVFK